MGSFAINPSCLYLGDIYNHWTIESLFKFHKPNLSPFEGSSWWLGWWWVLLRICQYYPWF